MKPLCGSSKASTGDVKSALGPNMNFDTYDDKELSNEINRAFVGVMDNFLPLSDDVHVQMDNNESVSVTEQCVMSKLKGIKAYLVVLMGCLIGFLRYMQNSSLPL